MDTQLKQRLTGAIVLVTLAVLIVPELLTGPKAPSANAPTSTESAPIRSYTIDLTGAKPPSVTAPMSADGAGAASAAATIAPTAPIAPANPTASSSAAVQGAASQPAAAPPTVAPGFAVQLGSFANPATAAKLAEELRAAGFRVSMAPVRAGGRELLRVRVGPVANRAAAEALLKKLSATGHKGPIVPFP